MDISTEISFKIYFVSVLAFMPGSLYARLHCSIAHNRYLPNVCLGISLSSFRYFFPFRFNACVVYLICLCLSARQKPKQEREVN